MIQACVVFKGATWGYTVDDIIDFRLVNQFIIYEIQSTWQVNMLRLIAICLVRNCEIATLNPQGHLGSRGAFNSVANLHYYLWA